MQIIDFIELCNLRNKSEVERAKLVCFYNYKETGIQQFTIGQISDFMVKFGFNAPNISRLKDKLIKGKAKAFLLSKNNNGLMEFIPAVLQIIESDFGSAWNDVETIESSGTLIDESKFCRKRHYLDRLIMQINHSYEGNCYDACAVLMRRLFEVMLILTYQKLNIDDQIKNNNGNGYVMLDFIVKNAVSNQTLKLSRNKNEYDTFRKIGNFSAHNITYIAGKKDIDDIKLNYRVMLEELYNKAGLLELEG
jgi:hypothetical protein